MFTVEERERVWEWIFARYQEMPYVVRRRRTSDPEGKRIRISEESRGIQEDLTFYSAWTLTESGHVGRAYGDVVRQTREIAGGAIRDAWNEPSVQRDEDMNMPALGLGDLAEARARYLAAVSRRLRFLGGGGKRPNWISGCATHTTIETSETRGMGDGKTSSLTCADSRFP